MTFSHCIVAVQHQVAEFAMEFRPIRQAVQVARSASSVQVIQAWLGAGWALEIQGKMGSFSAAKMGGFANEHGKCLEQGLGCGLVKWEFYGMFQKTTFQIDLWMFCQDSRPMGPSELPWARRSQWWGTKTGAKDPLYNMGKKIGAAYRLKVMPRVKALKKYRETGKEPWSIMEQCVWSSLGQFVVANHTRLLSISFYHLPPSKLI